MRMLLNVTFPLEPFNTLVRENRVGPAIQKILSDIKPEAVYFTEQDGTRGAMLVVEAEDASQIPALAEPFFLTFNADCRFRIAMTLEDLGASGLDKLGTKWR